jgi:Cyclic nucleotide-binding domain
MSVTAPKRVQNGGPNKSQQAASMAAVPRFDAREFLASAGAGRSTNRYKTKKTIFRQDDPADAVFYIQEGNVKLTVVSQQGKEAIIAMLGAGGWRLLWRGMPNRAAIVPSVGGCNDDFDGRQN